VKTSIDTLKAMKRTETDLDANTFIVDDYIRAAFKQSGLDYEAHLKNYAKSPLVAKDALSGKAITDPKRVGQIWVQGEPLVRHYASLETALSEARKLEKSGKKIRTVYAHDRETGLKLLAADAWFVQSKNEVSAFLLKSSAEAWAKKNNGKVLDFSAAKAGGSV